MFSVGKGRKICHNVDNNERILVIFGPSMWRLVSFMSMKIEDYISQRIKRSGQLVNCPMSINDAPRQHGFKVLQLLKKMINVHGICI